MSDRRFEMLSQRGRFVSINLCPICLSERKRNYSLSHRQVQVPSSWRYRHSRTSTCFRQRCSPISLRRWLRLPVVQNIPPGHCVCSSGFHRNHLSSGHLLTCLNEGILARRHDDLWRALWDMASSAGLTAEEAFPASARMAETSCFMIIILASQSSPTLYCLGPPRHCGRGPGRRTEEAEQIRLCLPPVRSAFPPFGHQDRWHFRQGDGWVPPKLQHPGRRCGLC